LEKLTILPLGGLGEIGMNAMLIAWGDDAILIDCGVLFPDVDQPGVDYIIPDFHVLERYHLLAYVITHGHEDHIGALPYALPVAEAPIYASRFTCGLIKHKLGEWGMSFDLHEVAPRDTVTVGPFSLEFMRVTHSIPDGLAIAVTTPVGVVIHTGDFKIDHAPIGGEKTDLARFADWGERGVLALLSDSTNSDLEGVSLSESSIGRGLREVMRSAEARIFVASFASHIHRLQQIIDISRELGRRTVLNGRSMIQNVRMAREMGLLKAPDSDFMELEDAKDAPPSLLTVLTTGSQAEPGSALSRLALGDSHHLRIGPNDVVVFSSRSIPGNEQAISRAINGLTRQGARVIYGHETNVHTSGHAHREEQRLMINLVKPRYFIPVHGELHHLTAHAETARQCGVEKIFVIEDGQPVEFERSGGEVDGYLGEPGDARKIMVDGDGVGDVTATVLRDRNQLAEAGMVICVVTLDATSGEVAFGPDIMMRGVLADDARLVDDLKNWVRTAINEQTPTARRDRPTIEEAVRVSVRRFFKRELDRKPVVLPVVLQV
jgi:ribonuclease J